MNNTMYNVLGIISETYTVSYQVISYSYRLINQFVNALKNKKKTFQVKCEGSEAKW